MGHLFPEQGVGLHFLSLHYFYPDEKQKAEVWSSRRRQRRRRGCRWMTKRMLMKDQERSYEENLKQLKAKMKDEAERVRKEAAQVLEYRLKEQEAILSKGFTKQMELMQEEIEERDEVHRCDRSALRYLHHHRGRPESHQWHRKSH